MTGGCEGCCTSRTTLNWGRLQDALGGRFSASGRIYKLLYIFVECFYKLVLSCIRHERLAYWKITSFDKSILCILNLKEIRKIQFVSKLQNHLHFSIFNIYMSLFWHNFKGTFQYFMCAVNLFSLWKYVKGCGMFILDIFSLHPLFQQTLLHILSAILGCWNVGVYFYVQFVK